jgi:membrane protein DedA with SNARE-associated domain
MDGLVTWLTHVPLWALYVALCLIAAAENIFPPLPADTVVALGAWLAARGEGSITGVFLSTWIGNVAGAAGMYVIGRTHGAGWMRRKFPRLMDEKNAHRLAVLYGRYGIAALVVSRFIPGVRALVPPFAGALRIPPVSAIAAMAIASAVWYGTLSYVAFTAGSDWNELVRLVKRFGTHFALVAALVLIVGVAIWYLNRNREVETTPDE